MGQLVDTRNGVSKTNWNFAIGAGGITNTSNNTLIAASGMGWSNVLTTLYVKNVSAVASEFIIRDGGGGSILYRGFAPASMLTADVIQFSTPLTSSVSTALIFAMITNATQTYVGATGFQVLSV